MSFTDALCDADARACDPPSSEPATCSAASISAHDLDLHYRRYGAVADAR